MDYNQIIRSAAEVLLVLILLRTSVSIHNLKDVVKLLDIRGKSIMEAENEFTNDFNNNMKVLATNTLKYEVVRKHYYEMFSKEFNKDEAIILSELQYAQNTAIHEEIYEDASEIQKEINILITNNETIKDKNTDNK